MDAEANKALVRRFVEEVFEQLQVDAVDELVADDFVSYTWPSPTGDGKADLRRATERIASALSDIDFEINDMIAEGDRVAVRLTASATQTGEIMNIPPSGKRYTIAEHWHQLDAIGMMSQLKPDATNATDAADTE